MSPEYTPKLAASHINSGTSIALDELNMAGGNKTVLRLPKLHLELDARLPATCHGGITLLLSLWRQFNVADTIDDKVSVLQRHRPYHESDHVLAQVLNLFTGGTCIEDQATLQQDLAVLRLLGSERFPDPTTSGDFLRRFDERCNPGALDGLREATDQVRQEVWSDLQKRHKRRKAKLGKWGLVDMDSHIAEFTSRQKEGADFSYTGRWSYHPLLVSLANTSEVLAVRNRPGNVTSADGVEDLLDEQLPQVTEQFEHVVVRGDSAFDRASIRATCAQHGAHFATVARRRPGWVALAQDVPEEEWQDWLPPARRRAERRRRRRGYRHRRKGIDQRSARATQRGYSTLSKHGQWVTEVACRPTKKETDCRLIIVRELIQHSQPELQPVLIETYGYRYIITDLPDSFSPSDVVDQAYQRCDQENIIEQLKNELAMWRMPVREAAGNDAWLEIARLAWNIGKWLSLLALPLETLRWEWKRFRRSFVYVAAEVVLRSRQTWIRFNPSHRYIPTIMKAHRSLGP